MGVKIRDGVPRYRKVRGMDRLMRLTGLWAHYGNTLGPGINGRYGAAHRRARGAFRGEALAGTTDTLAARGILHVPEAFPRDEALSLSDAFDRAIEERPEAVRRPIEGVFGLKRPLDVLGEAPLAVLDGPVRAALEAHYRSHFRVEWLDCYRSTPAAAQATSWLWHMDNVPRGCLKVMLLLSDAGRDQGAMRFHPRPASRALQRAGYFGIELEERGADLAAWRRRAGVGAEEYIEAAAGDALLFDPNLLHKAVPPEQGRRDVMTFLVMPSALPWNEALARQGLDRIQRDPGGYPPTPEI